MVPAEASHSEDLHFVFLGFPTLLTTSGTEKAYFELMPSSFKFGFSVRAAGNVQVLLCEGWNPKSYPCYFISTGDVDNKMVYLRKIGAIQDTEQNAANLDAYKVRSVKTFPCIFKCETKQGLLAIQNIQNDSENLRYRGTLYMYSLRLSYIYKGVCKKSFWYA